MAWLAISFGAVGLCALFLIVWQLSDKRQERAIWNDLLQQAGTADPAFDSSIIDALPEPAQRYFRYTIAPGAPLVTVVDIEREDQLGLGTKDKRAYRPMTARQIFAPPKGLVWRMCTGSIMRASKRSFTTIERTLEV